MCAQNEYVWASLGDLLESASLDIQSVESFSLARCVNILVSYVKTLCRCAKFLATSLREYSR
jgi:hypothetical protein